MTWSVSTITGWSLEAISRPIIPIELETLAELPEPRLTREYISATTVPPPWPVLARIAAGNPLTIAPISSTISTKFSKVSSMNCENKSRFGLSYNTLKPPPAGNWKVPCKIKAGGRSSTIIEVRLLSSSSP